MRSFILAALLGLATLTALPQQSEAYWRPRFYSSSYPYGGTTYYYPYPTYYYGPAYSTPSYYWSGRYYTTPYGTSYYYGAYSPWTNTYYYNTYAYPYRW